MSTNIDQRVVEMRFDNAHFEKNVSNTMSTLDKLKNALNFSGASSGLENIGKAAKDVDMSNLDKSVGTLSAKFSALEVMAVTALANITNSAVNAGKNIVKALTITPITTGLDEYETKMGSIQTIMANTEHQGTTMDDVTAALQELNLYADKTIYNFQEMTRNIGTFTAAGVDLDTSVKAIQGIANLAAVSGSTSQQASTAMYQLSQALATGTVKLMDWNSVVNAGMGGKVFQNALIRTAAMLDGAAQDVEAWQAKNVDAYGSFRESLTSGAWLTSEVLTETLKQFTMAAEEGSEEWEAFKKSLMDKGYAEDQAEAILKMANTATDAATKVKTFTQLFDVMKESAQSGWAQTWEILFGDFEEAKEFFSKLSDVIGGLINGMSDYRNNLLGGVFDSNWDKLISKINEASIKTTDFEEKIRELYNDDDSLDKLIEQFGSLEKAIKAGEVPADLLKKALASLGTNTSEAETKIAGFVDGLKEIERVLGYGSVGDDVKKLQTALEELGHSVGTDGIDGIIGPNTQKAIIEFQKAAGIAVDGIAGPETIAALEKAGNAIEKIAEDTNTAASEYDDLIDNITKKGGRELFLEGFTNVIKSLVGTFDALGTAWSKVFPADGIHTGIIKAVEAFNNFSKTLLVTEEALDENGNAITKFNEKGENLVQVFEGVFAAVDILLTVLGGPLKIAFSVLEKILSHFDLNILDAAAALSRSIVDIRDWVDSVFDVSGAIEVIIGVLDTFGVDISEIVTALVNGFNKIKDVISDVVSFLTEIVVDGVSEWIEKLKETEFFKDCAAWIEDACTTIADAISDLSTRFTNFSTSSIAEKLSAFGDIISGIASKLTNSKIFNWVVDNICGAFSKLKEFFTGFELPEINLDNLSFFTKRMRIFDNAAGIGDLFSNFGADIKNNFIKWDWDEFKIKTLASFAEWWLTTGDKIKRAFEKCKEVATAIKEFIFGTEDITLMSILNVIEKLLKIQLLIVAMDTLDTIISPLDNITDGLNNIASALKWEAIGAAFKAMAITMGILTVCLVIIASMPAEDATRAALTLGGLMVVLGGVIMGMAALTSKIDGGINVMGVVLSLLALAGAIAILVYALKEIDDMKLDNYWGTFGTLALVLIALSAGLKMISKTCNGSFGSVLAILTMLAGIKMMLEIIEAYDAYNWNGKLDAIIKMIGMISVMALALNVASRGIKAGASIQGMAMMMLAMVLSLKMLLGIIEDFAAMDSETFLRGGAAVAALMGIMTGMIAVANLTSQGTVLEKGQRSVNNFTGLAVALLAVVGAVYLLGKMATNDYDTFISGIAAVSTILILFTSMLAVIGKSCSGLKMGSIITLLAGTTVIMLVLTTCLHSMKDFDWKQSLASAGALGGLLLAMVGVWRILMEVPPDLINFGIWIAGMAGLAGIIYGLSWVFKNMKGLSWDECLSYTVALSAVLLAMVAALKILTEDNISLKNIYKWVLGMAGLGLVVGELALILWLIRDVNPVNAMGQAVALSGMLFAIAGCLKILAKHRHYPKTIKQWVLGMAGLGLVVGGLATILWLIRDVDPVNAMGQAVALSALLFAIAGCLKLCNNLTVTWNTAAVVGAIAALGLVVLELGYFLHVMEGWNVGDQMDDVLVLSTLLGALTLVMAACAGLGLISTFSAGGMFAAVGAIAVLGLVVLELGAVLGYLKQYEIGSMMNDVLVLSTLLGALTIVAAACVGLGLIATFSAGGMMGAILGIAVLGLVVLELGEVLGYLKQYEIGSMMDDVLVLSTLLGALTIVATACSLLGLVAGYALVGTGVLLAFVYALAQTIAAIGKFASSPEVQGFIDTGLSTLEKLAYGLGSMASAFADGFTSNLPSIGKNLSDFATELEGFIDTMGTVEDTDVAENAGILAGAILKLTAADFLENVTPGSLSSLGTDLSDFANNAGDFISAISDIDADAATSVEALASAIEALSTANLKDAIKNLLPGDNSLGTFGENISTFATCIEEAADALEGITDEDVANIQRSATAGRALADLEAAVPKKGGYWQDFAGESDLATFGDRIAAFGLALMRYSNTVTGQKIDTEAITASAAAGTALADLESSVPKKGGYWQDFAGESDLAEFGNSIVAFAQCLVKYSNTVTGATFDSEAVKNSATAAQEIAAVYDYVPKTGGIWQEIVGEQDLINFGNSLAAFGTGLVSYCESVKSFDDITDETTAIQNSVTLMEEIQKVIDTIDKTGGLWQGLVGEKDPLAFGTGLSALATGITDYITTINSLGDVEAVKTTIQNTGSVITELGSVMELIPDTDHSVASANLKSAVTDLKAIASLINSITTAEYDYTGLDGLETAISQLVEIAPDEESISTIATGYGTLVAAVNCANDIANVMCGLSSYTYTGIDSFKAALKNLSEADIDAVIETFSGKSSTMANAITAVIAAMTSAIDNGADDVSDSMSSLVDGAYSAIESREGDFETAGENLSSKVSLGVFAKKDMLLTTMSNIVSGMLGTLDNASDDFKDAGDAIGSSVASGAGSESCYTAMCNSGKYLGDGLVAGIEAKYDAAYWAGYALGQKAVQGEMDGQDSDSPSKLAIQAGKYLGEGLVIGIAAKYDAAYWAGHALGRKAVQGEMDGQASNSPSKWTIQAGEYLGDGLVIGMDNSNDDVYNAGFNLGETVTDALSTGLDSVGDLVTDHIVDPLLEGASEYEAVGEQYNAVSEEIVENEASFWEELLETKRAGAEAERYEAMELLDFQEDILAQTSEVYDNYLSEVERKRSSLMDTGNIFSGVDKSVDVGDIFSEVDEPEVITAQTLTQNLSDRVDQMQEYTDIMASLNGRIANEDLLATINEMGVSSLAELRALNSMTEEELAEYVGLFEQNYALVQDEVTGETLTQNLADQVEEMREYADIMASLNGRIDNEALLDAINEMDVSSLAELRALNSMTDEELANYVGLFEEKFALCNDTALTQLSSLREETEEQLSNILGGVDVDLSSFETMFDGTFESIDKYISVNLSNSMAEAGEEVGEALVDGFAEGVAENTPVAEEAAAEMANAAADAAREELDINSPSKVFMKMGAFVPTGFALGVNKTAKVAAQSMRDMVGNAIGGARGAIDGFASAVRSDLADTFNISSAANTLSTTISKIADTVNDGIDAQPTIRPVLDLSSVQSGARTINSLFDQGTSVDLLANVNGINSVMNRRNQNGVNGDVVSAIDKLSRKMDNINNASYTINGITYDDGSNVANAIETLVRATVRERRV